MRRWVSGSALLLLATAVGGCGDTGGAGDPRYLSIGTGGTGGVYYPLGGALASMLSVADPSRQYTAEVTGGAVENVNRLRSGEMDIALAISTTLYEAYTGGADFPTPHTQLRIVAPLYPNLTHVVVRRGSTLRSVAELRGLRVSVGSPGSGTEQLARHVLEAYGLAPEDVEPQYLSFTESAAALSDGAIDAAIISVGYPASAVLEATTTGGARLLAVDGDGARTLMGRYPYYTPATIPKGAYPGVDADVITFAVMNWVVANESLDDAIATLVLDVLRDQRDRLVQVAEIARQIDLEALRYAPIPLHPAAQRWLDSPKSSGE
ncbi:MAG: TAXI family TRAP transporter solute-binding subunit [Gemmatimonadetes bacterium]|nr:TAXI family TRAP transporter solute-binding subunit [Gemmatimonadota bacterium]